MNRTNRSLKRKLSKTVNTDFSFEDNMLAIYPKLKQTFRLSSIDDFKAGKNIII